MHCFVHLLLSAGQNHDMQVRSNSTGTHKEKRKKQVETTKSQDTTGSQYNRGSTNLTVFMLAVPQSLSMCHRTGEERMTKCTPFPPPAEKKERDDMSANAIGSTLCETATQWQLVSKPVVFFSGKSYLPRPRYINEFLSGVLSTMLTYMWQSALERQNNYKHIRKLSEEKKRDLVMTTCNGSASYIALSCSRDSRLDIVGPELRGTHQILFEFYRCPLQWKYMYGGGINQRIWIIQIHKD